MLATAQQLSLTAQTLYHSLLKGTTARQALAAQAARLEQAMRTFHRSNVTCPPCQAISASDANRKQAIDGQLQELGGRVEFIVLHCSWPRMADDRLAAYVNGLFGDMDNPRNVIPSI